MGREIRRVPPNWEHPKNKHGAYRPLYNRTFKEAVTEWKEAYTKWENGEDEDKTKYPREDGTPMEYWEWSGDPPDREYYKPYQDIEATWFQVYETVSEGTPITPAFESLEDLTKHLAFYGDSLVESKWKDGPWGWDYARAFVKSGWAPSGVCIDGKFFTAKEACLALEKAKNNE